MTFSFPSGGYLLSRYLPHKSTRNKTIQETPETSVCITKARIFVHRFTLGIFFSQAEETPAVSEVSHHHSTTRPAGALGGNKQPQVSWTWCFQLPWDSAAPCVGIPYWLHPTWQCSRSERVTWPVAGHVSPWSLNKPCLVKSCSHKLKQVWLLC